MALKVNYQYTSRIKAELRSLNKIALEEIEWVDDSGQTAQPSAKALAEFRFTGLNNCDFPELYPQEFQK